MAKRETKRKVTKLIQEKHKQNGNLIVMKDYKHRKGQQKFTKPNFLLKSLWILD